MKLRSHILTLLFLVVLCGRAGAQNLMVATEIDSVVVVVSRPLSQIGVQRMRLDSTVLRENVTLSLADALAVGSNVFIKSYGRATLATASVRGTAPSHTSVTWNGLKLNSPMLGMVDFSQIPAYFIDDASVLSGAGSLAESSGGLGGAVALTTTKPTEEGFSLKAIQGVSSYSTYDTFLRTSYATEQLQLSLRGLYTSSENDYTYINHNKVGDPIYDAEGNLTGYTHPTDVNRHGDYRDKHLLGELFYKTRRVGQFNSSVWYADTDRGVPRLGVDYRGDNLTRANQHDRSLRSVAQWSHLVGGWKMGAALGYNYTDLLYTYDVDNGNGSVNRAVESHTYLNMLHSQVEAEVGIGSVWHLSGNLTFSLPSVVSRDVAALSSGKEFEAQRAESSLFLAARWKPTERFGAAVNLRLESYDGKKTQPIPALFVEYTLLPRTGLLLKASATRNYRQPTLNDLYFVPGGNPDLLPEEGFTWDAGLQLMPKQLGAVEVSGEATWFDSHIDNWIFWRPTHQGFWTPLNTRVHSYGAESKLSATARLGGVRVVVDGMAAYTRSVNLDAPTGKVNQLPYVPLFSSSLSTRVVWREWSFAHKLAYYSRRYTTDGATTEAGGSVPPYAMNDLSLSRALSLSWADVTLRFEVKNLFDIEYESVLAHPMPGRNFGFFIELTPKL